MKGIKLSWFVVVTLFCSLLLSGCGFDNKQDAINLAKERAEKHLKQAKFKNLYVVEESGSSEDFFKSYVCGDVNFNDMYGVPVGDTRFMVRVKITKNGSVKDTVTSDFKTDPKIDNEWFERQWKIYCTKP